MRVILISAGGKPVISHSPKNNFPGLYLLQATVPIFATSTYYLCFPTSVISVTQSCLTLCDPMNRRMPGLPVHHQLLESTQTHVHRVGDTIQPVSPSVVPFSRLQSFPASGSFLMSQFFISGRQSIGASASASVLPMNIQN